MHFYFSVVAYLVVISSIPVTAQEENKQETSQTQ
jgi:hypothetical protein